MMLPTCNDGHGVYLLVDELFCFSQQFTRQYHHTGGTITHLIILHLTNICRVRGQEEGHKAVRVVHEIGRALLGYFRSVRVIYY